MEENKLYITEDKAKYLLINPEKLVHSLRFSGDKIEFVNGTIKVVGFTVKEFIEGFDRLVFVDKEGHEAIYEKKKTS